MVYYYQFVGAICSKLWVQQAIVRMMGMGECPDRYLLVFDQYDQRYSDQYLSFWALLSTKHV